LFSKHNFLSPANQSRLFSNRWWLSQSKVYQHPFVRPIDGALIRINVYDLMGGGLISYVCQPITKSEEYLLISTPALIVLGLNISIRKLK